MTDLYGPPPEVSALERTYWSVILAQTQANLDGIEAGYMPYNWLDSVRATLSRVIGDAEDEIEDIWAVADLKRSYPLIHRRVCIEGLPNRDVGPVCEWHPREDPAQ